MYQHIEYELAIFIEAMYRQQGRDAEITLMVIMETLLPLMLRRHKENQKPPSYRQNNQYK